MSAERPRVLYITHRVPHPPDKGDRIRNFHLLRALAGEFRVSLACLADEAVSPESLAELQGLCERVAVVPTSKPGRLLRVGLSFLRGRSLSEGAFASDALSRAIAGWQSEESFGAAVVSASSLVPYLRSSALRSVPAFVDVVDVDSQKWLDFAPSQPWPKRRMYRLEGRRVRTVEADLPKWVRASVLVSRAEADVFDGIAGAGAGTVATNGVDLDYYRPGETPAVAACAFVGALDYLPNVDAAVWFATEVWPAIRAKCPGAEFRLIGRKPTAEVQKLAAIDGVRLIGQVPDVRPHLADAAVVVVPMRLSRGLQNKVLEALAMGKATVAAPPALAAIKTKDGRDLLRAESVPEWVEAVVGLLNDEPRRRELGANGRRFVDENHDWTTCLMPLTDLVRTAATERRASALRVLQPSVCVSRID